MHFSSEQELLASKHLQEQFYTLEGSKVLKQPSTLQLQYDIVQGFCALYASV